MLKVFSIGYKETPYQLPSGWLTPFSNGPLALINVADPYRDAGQGDSIAHLNDCFSELTAHYWVWKNVKDVGQIGFCHHRRYFNFIELEQIAQPKLLADPSPELLTFLNQPAQAQQAQKILETSDVIASRMYCLPETISSQFCQAHGADIWSVFVQTVQDIAPEWLSRYLPWFDVSHEFRFYPVFIMPWAVFDEFCSLMFPVLFEVHRRIGPKTDGPGVRFPLKRYPAYLSERFMMLYFQAKGLRLYGAQLIVLEAGA